MTSRGPYRSIYDAIFDDPDFIALGRDGQHLWWVLKHRLGRAGIDRVYVAELQERFFAEDRAEIEAALERLAAHFIRYAWLSSGRLMIWMRNSLRYEPNWTPGNRNHARSVLAHVRGLPRHALVREFMVYYARGVAAEVQAEWAEVLSHLPEFPINPASASGSQGDSPGDSPPPSESPTESGNRERDREREESRKGKSPLLVPGTEEHQAGESSRGESSAERMGNGAQENPRGEAARIVRSTWWRGKNSPSSSWAMGDEYKFLDREAKRHGWPLVLRAMAHAPVELGMNGKAFTGKLVFSRKTPARWTRCLDLARRELEEERLPLERGVVPEGSVSEVLEALGHG